MPNILHRLTIDAPTETVQRTIATRAGIEQWWTGQAVTGEESVGGQLSVHFGGRPEPAATFEVLERGAERIVWRCVAGPEEWIGTQISYVLTARPDGGTTLLFRHDGWQQESEFMNGCSTNWAAYLMSLKSGAEGRGYGAYPAGEMSRWD